MIVRRYLYREIHGRLVALLGALLALVAVLQLLEQLVAVTRGQLLAGQVLWALSWQSIILTPLLLTASFFLALLIGYLRLEADGELPILLGAGMGPGRQVGLCLTMGLTTGALAMALSLYAVPAAHHALLRAKQQAREGLTLDRIAPRRFHRLSGYGVVYLERMDSERGVGEEGFFYLRQGRGREEILTADRVQAEVADGGWKVRLEGGRHHLTAPDGLDYRFMDFEGYELFVAAPEPGMGQRIHRTLPSVRLWGSRDPMEQAELQWRLAPGLICVSLAPLGFLLPLALTASRRHRVARTLLAGMGVFAGDYFLLVAARSLLEDGYLPAAFGLWWVHGLPLLLAVALYRRHARYAS